MSRQLDNDAFVECLYRLGRYREIVEFAPGREVVGAARLAVGLSLFRKGDVARARGYFTPALIVARVPDLRPIVSVPKTAPQLEVALHVARGLEQSLTYHYGDAGREFRLAAALAPHDPVVRYFLAHRRYWLVTPDPYKYPST